MLRLLKSFAILMTMPMPGAASDGNIGIFSDVDKNHCAATVACGETTTLYVYALLEGASTPGIIGAEYSVAIGRYDETSFSEDLGPDSLAFFQDNTPVLDLGGITLGDAWSPEDPIDRGINIAFPGCQTGDGQSILLQTVLVLNVGCPADEVWLRIIRHDSFFNQVLQCPMFSLCDEPSFTKICLGQARWSDGPPCEPGPLGIGCFLSASGQLVINPNAGTSCTVPVLDTTWSELKALYR